jgi:PKD repeat protein
MKEGKKALITLIVALAVPLLLGTGIVALIKIGLDGGETESVDELHEDPVWDPIPSDDDYMPVILFNVDEPTLVEFHFIEFDKIVTAGKWYIVHFGDGNSTGWIQERTVYHSYKENGTYLVEVFRANYLGEPTAAGQTTIDLSKIGSMPPVPVVRNEQLIYYYREQPVMLSADGSYDPDGYIVGYYWDFGDGTHSDVSQGINGYLPGKVVAHSYERTGNYQAKLYVMDDTGMINTPDQYATIEVKILPNR